MKKKKIKMELEPLITIIKDTREKAGFNFKDYKVINRKLETGDYSLENFEDQIVIERKGLIELFSCFGTERERFFKEIERMKLIPYRFIVVEGNYDEIDRTSKAFKISARSIKGSLTSLQLRYGIHILMAGTHELAEELTLDILLKFKKYVDRGDIL